MRISTVLAISALIGVAACGGGGGGGGGGPPPTSVSGNGFAPTTGPGDTSSYFPVGAGDKWVADFTTTDPKASAASGTATVTVTGTMTIDSATAIVFSVANSTSAAGAVNAYFSVSNGGVTNLGNTDPGDAISPLITPYVQLLFPVQAGQVSNVAAQKLSFGKDAKGNPVSLDLTQTISNAGMETVDVPAGTFANALKQTTTINATAHDDPQSAPITGSETTWHAPGVGEIKDQASASSAGTTISTTSDLRSYVINGQPHGIEASGTLEACSVFMGGAYWLIWESSDPQTQLNATCVSTSGTLASTRTDGFTIVPQQSYTRTPVLASSSSGSLLAWVQVDPNTRQT